MALVLIIILLTILILSGVLDLGLTFIGSAEGETVEGVLQS